MRNKYQSEASVIRPAIEAVLKHRVINFTQTLLDELVDDVVVAVLKAQRKHNREVIGEE